MTFRGIIEEMNKRDSAVISGAIVGSDVADCRGVARLRGFSGSIRPVRRSRPVFPGVRAGCLGKWPR